jgi:two-component system response regulator PilR (NtrC family)
MQVKLLRVIQEGKVRKLGGAREDVIDVRILCATHSNLAQEVRQNHFRQDLYYRLNVIELHLPPLRDRREDIPLLCEALLLKQESLTKCSTISAAALTILMAHDYPGNVRELQNILERASAFASDGVIDVDDLIFGPGTWLGISSASVDSVTATAASAKMNKAETLPEKIKAFERELIVQALRKNRFRQTRTASILGISLRQLRYRMQRLNIHDLD